MIKLNSYALYDEDRNCDYMVYEVILSDGRKEYVSRELFKYLQSFEEVKEIATHYNWDCLAQDVFSTETDRKWMKLFEAAVLDVQEDYRKARAFDKIKNKKVNVSLLLNTKDYYDYNDHVVRAQIYLHSNAECLTQEEFNSIKEALNKC